MALFVVIGHDGPDGTARRNEHRDAHVAFIEALDKAGRITFAGPIKSDELRPIHAPAPKFDEPAAISLMFGSVSFISLAASRANLP